MGLKVQSVSKSPGTGGI